jgi:hypothetical protein
VWSISLLLLCHFFPDFQSEKAQVAKEKQQLIVSAVCTDAVFVFVATVAPIVFCCYCVVDYCCLLWCCCFLLLLLVLFGVAFVCCRY